MIAKKPKDRSGGRKGGDTRRCSRCPESFVLTDAQAKWGETRCGACRSADQRANHEKNRERNNEKTRRYWRENVDRVRELRRRWQKSEAFKANLARYRAENADKLKARGVVAREIRRGRLQKQPCTDCGTGERVQAHHEDYSKPLEIEWLCPACHGARHRSAA